MCCLKKQTTLVEKSTKTKNNIESETRKRLIDKKKLKVVFTKIKHVNVHTHIESTTRVKL